MILFHEAGDIAVAWRKKQQGTLENNVSATRAAFPKADRAAWLHSSRMRREARTVTAMVHRYCRDHHNSGNSTLCSACADLLRYALVRLQHCPFRHRKGTCAKCPVHCYSEKQRHRIKAVMRYAGPRLLWTHPWLSFLHLLDGLALPRASRRTKTKK